MSFLNLGLYKKPGLLIIFDVQKYKILRNYLNFQGWNLDRLFLPRTASKEADKKQLKNL